MTSEIIHRDAFGVTLWADGLLSCNQCDYGWCMHRQHYLTKRTDRETFWVLMRNSLGGRDDYLRLVVPLLPRQGLIPQVHLTSIGGDVENGVRVQTVVQIAKGMMGAAKNIGILAPDVDSLVSLRHLMVDWIRDEETKFDNGRAICPSPFHKGTGPKMEERRATGKSLFSYNAFVLCTGSCAKCAEVAKTVGLEADGTEAMVSDVPKKFAATLGEATKSIGDIHKAFDEVKKAFGTTSLDVSARIRSREATPEEIDDLKIIAAKSSRPKEEPVDPSDHHRIFEPIDDHPF